MLQLQHSYQSQDTELAYARGCATDRYVAYSAVGGVTHVLSSGTTELLYTRHDEGVWATSLFVTYFGADPRDEVLLTTHGSKIRVYTLKTG